MIRASDAAESVPLSRGLRQIPSMIVDGIAKDAGLLLAAVVPAVLLTLLMWRLRPDATADLLAALAATPLIAAYLVVRVIDAIPSPSQSQITAARRQLGTATTGRTAKWIVALAYLLFLIALVSGCLYFLVGLDGAGRNAMVIAGCSLLAGAVALLLFSFRPQERGLTGKRSRGKMIL